MTHRIEFSPAAARQLRKLDARARRRVQAVVELLAQEPPPRQREEAHRRQWVGQGFPNQLGHGSRVTEHRGCTPCVNLGRRTGASTMPPSVPTAPGGADGSPLRCHLCLCLSNQFESDHSSTRAPTLLSSEQSNELSWQPK